MRPNEYDLKHTNNKLITDTFITTLVLIKKIMKNVN